MPFTISGLDREEFQPLFVLSDDELEQRGIMRMVATAKPGFPCRVTLEDAEPGESVLLLNYESHKTRSPFRSSYAIYIRENAAASKSYIGELPPVFMGRPMALRIFDKDGMLIGADLDTTGELIANIKKAFENPTAAFIHAHNAMHGCFAAEIRRS